MGCFNQTCAISGLPITAGMPVRFLLLTANHPEVGSGAVYNTDWWAPRTFPLRAEYNDYGSVENVQEGIQQALWIQGFQQDLIEHGTGENECHDVATYKATFTFDSMCTAIHETALFVDKYPGAANWDAMDAPSPQRAHTLGIPTLLSVRDTLVDAGFSVVDNWDEPGYLLNEMGEADVSIRWSQTCGPVDSVAKLASIRPALEAAEFQAVTVTGEHRHAMFRVFPKHGNTEFRGFSQESHRTRWSRNEDRKQQVSQAMVREDVWQMMLGLSIDGGYRYNGATLTIDTYVWYAQAVYDAYCAHLVRRAEAVVEAQARREARTLAGLDDDYKFELFESLMDSFFEFGGKARALRDNPVMWLMSKQGEGALQGVTLQDHFKLFAAEPRTPEEVTDFVRVVAEMALVRSVMSSMCKPWIPSIYHNQDTRDQEHTAFAVGVAAVATEWKRVRDEEYAEYEAEEAAEDEAATEDAPSAEAGGTEE